MHAWRCLIVPVGSTLMALAAIRAPASRAQSVADSNLKVQRLVTGLDTPTGIAFLNATGDALVTEKNTGRVKFLSGNRIKSTVLDLPVATESERGLLGITLSPTFATDKFVYLYHTVSTTNADGGDALANRISRFKWTGSSLRLDRKIIDLPGGPGPNHDGGKITFGPDGNLYAVIGDLNRREKTINSTTSGDLNRVGAILRLTPTGGPVKSNPFYSSSNSGANAPINDLYAYGVRNSFGLTFDHVSGQLWDTENGPTGYDEINRVKRGFNSGWRTIQGPVSRNPGASPDSLVKLGPNAYYADPSLSWKTPVAPTDLLFLNSSRLGKVYAHDLFVGDVNTGSIFHFDLSTSRNSLQLPGGLADGVADNSASDLLAEQNAVAWGSGFGVISDLELGPGGMYALSLSDGSLFRILANPASASAVAGAYASSADLRTGLLPEPSAGLIVILIAAMFRGRQRRTLLQTYPRRKRPSCLSSINTRRRTSAAGL